MKINSNFERARALTEKWPEWKRSYELTKDSGRGSPLAPTSVVRDSHHDQHPERNTAKPREAK